MPSIAQVNLIVADLDRSRAFYETLGIAFAGRDRTGHGEPEAWVSTNAGVTLVRHSTAFAAWWDPSGPRPERGSTQIDIELDGVAELEEALGALDRQGALVVKAPTDMPWGQRFAVVTDPDGNRVGLKAPLTGG